MKVESLWVYIAVLFLVIPIIYSFAYIEQEEEKSDPNIPTYIDEQDTSVTVVVVEPCTGCQREYTEEEETVTNIYYATPLSIETQDYIYQILDEYGMVDKYFELVNCIIYVESRFHKDAENGSCKGLMHVSTIHSRTMKELGITDLFDERQNIKMGIHILNECREWALKNGADSDETLTAYMLMAYNNGQGGAKKLINSGVTSTNYVEKVLAAKEELEVIG